MAAHGVTPYVNPLRVRIRVLLQKIVQRRYKKLHMPRVQLIRASRRSSQALGTMIYLPSRKPALKRSFASFAIGLNSNGWSGGYRRGDHETRRIRGGTPSSRRLVIGVFRATGQPELLYLIQQRFGTLSSLPEYVHLLNGPVVIQLQGKSCRSVGLQILNFVLYSRMTVGFSTQCTGAFCGRTPLLHAENYFTVGAHLPVSVTMSSATQFRIKPSSVKVHK